MSTQGYAKLPTFDLPVSDATRRTMQSNRRRDTAPELRLRSALHHSGLRYRVDYSLPFDRRRRADIVFTRVDLYVFVDGCFWHGCPEHFVTPKTRTSFWSQKIAGNQERDRDTDLRLKTLGCSVLRIWEHVPTEEAVDVVCSEYGDLLGRL